MGPLVSNSNPTLWKALENMKERIHYELLTVFSYVLQLFPLIMTDWRVSLVHDVKVLELLYYI